MVILLVFGVLEYRWFSVIAEEEYHKTHNSLVFTTNRIISREMQRTTLLTNWIDQVLLFSSDSSPDSLEEQLLDIYSRFGPDNPTDYLLTTIGYVDLFSDKDTESRYTENGFVEIPLDEELSVLVNSGKSMKTVVAPDIHILIPINERFIIVIDLDLYAFIESEVIPEIEQLYQNIEINWMISPEDPDFEAYLDDQGNLIEEYSFNPIRALLGDPYIETSEQIVPFIIGKDFKVPDLEKRSGSFSGPKPDMNMQPGGKIEMQDLEFLIAGISYSENTSYSSSIEPTLSIIFIGGILLILLIGCICILLLFQMRRVQNQRQKEREFTASITHELRTPLTIIQSASDNLAEGVITAQRVPAYGNLIKQQTHRLGGMIENILVYSRIEDKRSYTYHESPVRLDDFFNKIEQQLNILADEKQISIRWTVSNLSKEVYTDNELLELTVTNLISNGVYHAYHQKRGEIRVVVRFSDPKTLHCFVEDDGIGIPYKEQKEIWRSYYRGIESKDSQEPGSGLGLFIVKRNASILGGDVTLESPYPRLDGIEKPGCRFTINIPCKVNKNGKDTNNRG